MTTIARNVSYRKIPALLAARDEFDGNSMSARWNGDVYEVKSYATVIATSHQRITKMYTSPNVVSLTPALATRTVSIVENRWGVTTARHINLCKAWL